MVWEALNDRRKQQAVINLLMRLSVWGKAILSCGLKVALGVPKVYTKGVENYQQERRESLSDFDLV